jgi:hypothetical protein
MVFVLFQYMSVTMGCISYTLKGIKCFTCIYGLFGRLEATNHQMTGRVVNIDLESVCGRKRLRTNFGYYLILLHKT